MNLDEFRALLAKELRGEMGDEAATNFIQASNHPYTCRCDICRAWWKEMGPDEGSYGPFSKEEIEGPEADG